MFKWHQIRTKWFKKRPLSYQHVLLKSGLTKKIQSFIWQYIWLCFKGAFINKVYFHVVFSNFLQFMILCALMHSKSNSKKIEEFYGIFIITSSNAESCRIFIFRLVQYFSKQRHKLVISWCQLYIFINFDAFLGYMLVPMGTKPILSAFFWLKNTWFSCLLCLQTRIL